MKIIENYGRRLMKDMKLNLIQRLKLQLVGHVYIGHFSKPGWSDTLPHYAFKCSKHGLVVAPTRGYKKRLDCPVCREEMKQSEENNQETN